MSKALKSLSNSLDVYVEQKKLGDNQLMAAAWDRMIRQLYGLVNRHAVLSLVQSMTLADIIVTKLSGGADLDPLAVATYINSCREND